MRTGYLPDEAVPALLRQASVVAYPALEEGFGLPALEALACGAPLVTTEGTAMAEMAGRCGAPGATRRRRRAGRRAGHGPRGGPRHGAPGARDRGGGRADLGGERRAPPARPMRSRGRPRSRVPRMRALITGGKGFVGQWLAAHLKDRGDEVAVIDIETDVADGAAVRRVMADVEPRGRLPPGRDDPRGRELGEPRPGAARQRPRDGRDPGGRPLGRAGVPASWSSARPRSTGSSPRANCRSPRTPPRRRRAPTRPASWRPRRWPSRPGAATGSR